MGLWKTLLKIVKILFKNVLTLMLFRDIIEIASEYKIYSKAKNKNCQNNSTLYKDRFSSQLPVFFLVSVTNVNDVSRQQDNIIHDDAIRLMGRRMQDKMGQKALFCGMAVRGGMTVSKSRHRIVVDGFVSGFSGLVSC